MIVDYLGEIVNKNSVVLFNIFENLPPSPVKRKNANIDWDPLASSRNGSQLESKITTSTANEPRRKYPYLQNKYGSISERNYNPNPVYNRIEKKNTWEKIKNIFKYDQKIKEEKSEYFSLHSQDERVSIWGKVKSALFPDQPLYTEHHYLGPIPVIKTNDVRPSSNSNTSTAQAGQKYSTNEYSEIYKDAVTGLAEEFKDSVKDVLSPMETSDPETHLNNFINDPLVQDFVQKLAETQETFLTRVSEITRADIVNSGVGFWKIMYQLVLHLVMFIILTSFGIDIVTEGGLV